MQNNYCLVCGYGLDEAPYDNEGKSNDSVICPACGIHYGYDDMGGGMTIPDDLTMSDWKYGDSTHKRIINYWRDRWIAGGMQWWTKIDGAEIEKPIDWAPLEQMKHIPETFRPIGDQES